MDTTNAFLESWINAEHTLLGRKLKPLCLRHLLWLYATENALVVTNKTVTLAELELAAIICSSASDAQLTFLAPQKLSLFARFKESHWRRKNKKKADLTQETFAFLRYHDDFLKLPEFWEGKKEQECPLPFLLTHAAALIANTGWSEAEVFNMPVGKVIWLNIAFGYFKSGETNVMADKDIAARDALRSLFDNGREK